MTLRQGVVRPGLELLALGDGVFKGMFCVWAVDCPGVSCCFLGLFGLGSDFLVHGIFGLGFIRYIPDRRMVSTAFSKVILLQGSWLVACVLGDWRIDLCVACPGGS